MYVLLGDFHVLALLCLFYVSSFIFLLHLSFGDVICISVFCVKHMGSGEGGKPTLHAWASFLAKSWPSVRKLGNNLRQIKRQVENVTKMPKLKFSKLDNQQSALEESKWALKHYRFRLAAEVDYESLNKILNIKPIRKKGWNVLRYCWLYGFGWLSLDNDRQSTHKTGQVEKTRQMEKKAKNRGLRC